MNSFSPEKEPPVGSLHRKWFLNHPYLIKSILIHSALIVIAVLFLFPLVWMVTTSLKHFHQAVQIPPAWIPSPVVWSNYVDATTGNNRFWTYFGNTLFLCVLNIVGTVGSCSLVAYGFSRIEWPGRDLLFMITLATMMIPQPVLLVPLYQLFRDLGWIGSLKPLWAPAFFASAYNIFLIRQFFLTLPKELSEAAWVDGCSEWRIFWQIILPLSKPVLMVVGLFSFMFIWNDFMGPLIYLTDPDHFTLALGLQAYQSQLGGTEVHLLMAAAVLMVLPVVILFFFTQKTFIEGISLTGLKG